MIAVLGFDVDPRIGKGAGDGSKLARDLLLQAADQYRPDGRGAEPCRLQRRARGFAIFDQEMGMADAVHGEYTTAFEADACGSKGFAEACERTRATRQFDRDVKHALLLMHRAMTAKPTYFATEADFRHWLEANHESAPELFVGFWKKGSGKPSIDWPQARDQALCFGWIDGVRKSLGDDAYTIRFTPRRKGSIWSKVNVERFTALTADGQMTPAGERAYEENKHKSGLYSYEKPLASFDPAEETSFRKNKAAWSFWEDQPPGYRKLVLNWITTAKKPETRAKRLATLIEDCKAGRRIAGYDWRKK